MLIRLCFILILLIGPLGKNQVLRVRQVKCDLVNYFKSELKLLFRCILWNIMYIHACLNFSDFWQKKIFLFFKNNFTKINHSKFMYHRSHLKLCLNYLPCIVCREYFSNIFNVKKCTLSLYSIKICYKLCMKMIEHNSRSKCAPDPSEFGLWVWKPESPPLKQWCSTSFVLQSFHQNVRLLLQSHPGPCFGALTLWVGVQGSNPPKSLLPFEDYSIPNFIKISPVVWLFL